MTVGIILLVGTSRIYLGVRNPSDVASSISLGAAWALLLAGCFSFIPRSPSTGVVLWIEQCQFHRDSRTYQDVRFSQYATYRELQGFTDRAVNGSACSFRAVDLMSTHQATYDRHYL